MDLNKKLKNKYDNHINEDELDEIDELRSDELNRDKYIDQMTEMNNEKINDLMSKINDIQEMEIHDSREQNNIDKNNENEENNKRKRGIPKTLLQNQEKYMEVLKKQQMMKKGKNIKKKKDIKTNKKMDNIKLNYVNTENMRRLIVAGKVKYFPISENEIPTITHNNIKMMDKKINTMIENTNIQNSEQNNEIENINNRISNNLAKENKKTPIKYTEQIEKNIKRKMNKNNSSKSKKIPMKYAEQIEKDVKKQTIKNIRDFKDLRRIKAIENITVDSDFDPNKASIKELRKLRIEQRNNEQENIKKKLDANKRGSAVQEILNNDKMSKFAKTVAIKNLSAGSRNKRYSDKFLHNETN